MSTEHAVAERLLADARKKARRQEDGVDRMHDRLPGRVRGHLGYTLLTSY